MLRNEHRQANTFRGRQTMSQQIREDKNNDEDIIGGIVKCNY